MKALAFLLLAVAWIVAFAFAAWLVAQVAQWLHTANAGLASIL